MSSRLKLPVETDESRPAGIAIKSCAARLVHRRSTTRSSAPNHWNDQVTRAMRLSERAKKVTDVPSEEYAFVSS